MFDKSRSIFFNEGVSTPNETNQPAAAQEVDQYLRLHWEVGKRLEYGVLLLMEDNGKADEVKYTCSITRKEDDATGRQVFAIDRVGELYINERLPDLVADQLAYQVGQVFFPLAVQLDEYGGFLGLDNHQEILTRWSRVKEQVRENFEGDFSENYLSRMDQLLASADNIFSAFMVNDWLLNLFFQPLYKRYDNLDGNQQLYFPLLPSAAYRYETKEELAPRFNHFGAIALQQKGRLDVDRETFGVAIEGDYSGLYVLHPRHKHIIAFKGNWTFRDADVDKKVHVKFFYLPPQGEAFDKDFVASERPVNFVDMESISVKESDKQASFWNKWFTK